MVALRVAPHRAPFFPTSSRPARDSMAAIGACLGDRSDRGSAAGVDFEPGRAVRAARPAACRPYRQVGPADAPRHRASGRGHRDFSLFFRAPPRTPQPARGAGRRCFPVRPACIFVLVVEKPRVSGLKLGDRSAPVPNPHASRQPSAGPREMKAPPKTTHCPWVGPARRQPRNGARFVALALTNGRTYR